MDKMITRATDTEDKTALRGHVVKPTPKGPVELFDQLHEAVQGALEAQAEIESILKEREMK